MTDTGNPHGPASTPSDSPPASALTGERLLHRSNEGRMLTGVCAGLGRYAGIDPVLFRVGFAVLVLGSGIGIMLYVAAFLLMRETDGGPGYMEQWTRRTFDNETVLALLTGVFALGLVINVSSGGIDTGTVVVGTLFAIALLTAHARGVDLLAVTRSLPDRLRGRRVPPAHGQPPTAFGTTGPAAAEPYPSMRSRTGAMPTAPPAAQSPPAGPAPGPVPSSGETPAAGEVPSPERTPSAGDGPPSAGTPSAASTPSSGDAPPYPGPSPTAGNTPFRSTSPTTSMPSAPRTATRPSYDSSGEPFSPYGPYQPLDPRRRQQPYSPYDLSEYGGQVRSAPRPKRPRSFIGAVTLCLAMIVGGIIMAIQATSGSVNMTVVGGAALVTIGGGLMVAAWFGRGAALVAVGMIIATALVAGSALTGMPKRFGSYHWDPTTISEVTDGYAVGVGEGTLDLSDLTFPPGSRTVLSASVSVGQISVLLPPTARVEVNGYTKLGDVKIDHSVKGGADVRHNKVLEPEVTPEGDVATIVLNIKAGIGDVEVRRAA
ncbi:phage shock protein PspC (stress-responsive transcriptional regulator) [Streptosporangium album]|uniref:Phage shock protein PspC (Stress-responsive transcriptional regulator) n=1 Tax=Streptosporangium album TaxID=47479 RepID=A0A7W7RWV9_9ACTN|nr:PspC domain-containing protein [Streptosporangium album]MBB4939709.1 phage shock protein PspC (stress-responsive transcriptional regulator) [Streptosporangium album]